MQYVLALPNMTKLPTVSLEFQLTAFVMQIYKFLSDMADSSTISFSR